jgi:hypothetical protein
MACIDFIHNRINPMLKKEEWKDDVTGLTKAGENPFAETLSLFESNHGGPSSKSRTEKQKNGRTTHKIVPTVRKATLEIPLQLSDDKGVTMTKNTKMSASSSFPLGGPWSGSISGVSSMRGRTGFSTGCANVNYRMGSFGSMRGGVTVSEKPQVQVGGTASYAKSSLSASLSTLPTDPLNQWRASLSGSQACWSWLTVRSTCSFHRSAQPVSYMLSLATKAAHRVELGLGWNMKKPVVSLAVRPERTGGRQVSLSAQWKGKMNFQLGMVVTQTLQSAAQIGVGVWHASSRGFTWILTWTHGDLTLRIPVILSSVHEPLWSPFMFVYMSLMSKALDDALIGVLGLDGQVDEKKKKLEQQQFLLGRKKAREDAEQQQRLMKRQAGKIMAQEKERVGGGLVIRQATYWVKDGEALDVTIPLQFWVTESSLTLSESSKDSLLGFCDITADVSNEKEDSASSWWARFWTLPKGTGKSATNKPKLTIKYDLGGQSYEISVQGHKGLTLPSSRAVLLATEQ